MKDRDIERTFEEVRTGLNELFSRFTEDLIATLKPLLTVQKEEARQEKKAEIKKREPLTKEAVRSILLEKSKSGWKAEIKKALDRYSKNGTLTGVPEENYETLMREISWTCREPITAEEVQAMAEEIESRGFGNELKQLFEHHYATGVSDLKAEYYPSFMRDAEVIGNV